MPIVSTQDLNDKNFDSIVLVGSKVEDALVDLDELKKFKEVKKCSFYDFIQLAA